MSENYYSPEQRQYRDPIAAGNLLTRLTNIHYSVEELKLVLDPSLFNEAEAAIAGYELQQGGEAPAESDYVQQQERQALADAALANSLQHDTLSADEPSTEVPDGSEGIVASEESMLADTTPEEPAPWLSEEPPIWGGEE